MKNNALILIKPDGMHKLLVGHVINKFMENGLKIKGLKIVSVSKKLAQAHYSGLKDKHFFKNIVEYLMGTYHHKAQVVALVLSGTNVIAKCRHIAGATNPEEADPKSIRGSFGRITTQGLWENLVHVSSDQSEAQREIQLWFKKSELLK